MIISLYKDTFSKEYHNVPDLKIIQGILGGQWRRKIEDLAKLQDKEYKQAKTLLPCVTWSGTFSERLADKLVDYSGLLVLDIDNLEEAVLQNTIAQLATDPYVTYAFKSPSGQGLKIVVRVNTGPEHHLAAFLHLQKVFEEKYLLKIDNSGKDICRLCYMSYDPFAIIKDGAVFEVDVKYGEVQAFVPNNKFVNYSALTDPVKIYELCVQWVDRTCAYVPGQRNRYVHALACAMNRCGVNKDDTFSIFATNYSDLEEKEVRHCVDSGYFHNQHEHASVEVKDLESSSFKAPAYVMNYTDDVVENDLMRITATLHQHGIKHADIGDIVSKVAKYYKQGGFIDLDRSTLGKLMNKAIKLLSEKVAEQSEEFTLKYEDASSMGLKLIENDITEGIIPTYMDGFDQKTGGGLKPKSFYGLIGLGGTFKSIILQYIAYANAVNGVPVLYLNGEMSDFQFWERLAAMVYAIDLTYELKQKKLTKENIGEFIEGMKKHLGNNLFVVNGNGFNEQNVIATLDNIRATTGKTIRLIGIDGVSQMDPAGKEEIPAAIYNTSVCKEMAKNCNNGEGAVVIGLMHTSGEQNYTLRDTGTKCRGGLKTIANMDGYLSVSLLIDPETNSLENDDEILYIPSKVYVRLKDKRTRTGVVSHIVNINDKNLHLSVEDCDPKNYEIKITKKQSNG